MKKEKKALILNILIIIFEIIGLVYTVYQSHSLMIEYYTIDSNIITLISSLLFVIFYKKKKGFVKDIRFLATILLIVTFLVVVFILCPMQNFNYKLLMFTDPYFIFHTLCPILTMVSYIFFEEGSNKKIIGLAFTIIYAIVLITLNILDIISGPYPFLKVKEQSIPMTIMWGGLILLGSYLVGQILYQLNKIKGAKN